MNIDFKKFETEGYAGPFKLEDRSKFNSLFRERYTPRNNYTWYKSPHEVSAPIVRIASNSNIIDKLKNFIGHDILLWGSRFIRQKPNNHHAWHLDVEYGRWKGLTVWIGLKNLNEKTTISLISYSHQLNTAPKELEKNNIDTSDGEAILKEAIKLDARCELKTFYLKPGEFIIWSGRIWHSTINKSTKPRDTIILQYCTPNNIVKIPINYEYPNTQWSEVPPPCILISGKDDFNYNKVLSKESIEPSNEFLRELKTLVIYNIRYKFSAVYNRLKRLISF